jgi:RNA polymerase sigma factor (sigma-70 family)
MKTSLPAVVGQIRQLVQPPTPADATDRQLLQRFAAGRDEAAFAALVRRHGPMVLGVCRRLLGNAADADDAFQATFLVLARKAASPRWHDSVGGWLHQVARRVAREARERAARRRSRERAVAALPDVPAPEAAAAAARELGAALDEELERLPDRYRGPLLLCYLEGATRDRAAALLGLSLRTLERRLQRGRALLRVRLTRRGLTLTALLAAALVGEAPATSAALAGPTLKTAVAFAGGSLPAAGAAAARSVVLAEAVLAGTAAAQARLGLLLVLALTLGLAGAGVLAGGQPGAEPRGGPDRHAPPPSADEDKPPRGEQPGAPLPPGAVGRLGGTRFRHGIDVTTVAFTADGKGVASVGHDGTACLWDAATGRELHRFAARFPGKPFWGLRLAVSPDAKLLACAEPDEEAVIGLYELASGKELRRLRGHQVQIHALAFAPDGKTLASAAGDRTVRLWDVAGGQALHRLGPLPQGCEGLVFSRDGKTLVGAGPSAYLWDVATAREVRKIDAPRNRLFPVALSPDGRLLASGVSYDDATVYLWDAATGERLRALEGHRGRPACVAFSPDGKLLASGGDDRTIRLWDPATGKEVRRIQGHRMTVHSVAFSPDGKRLASGSMDSTLGLWDVATGADLRPDSGHWGAVASLALSPDGRTVASASSDRTIRLWDLSTRKQTRRLPGDDDSSSRVSFAADGKTLASAGHDGSLRMWDPGTGKEVGQFTPPDRGVAAAAFSPDGKVLVSAAEDGTVRLRETSTSRELGHAEGGLKNASCLDFSPGGLVAAGSLDGVVAFWEAATGKELRRLKVSGDRIHLLACAPGGKLLAWAGLGTTIYLTDAATGERRGQLAGHQENVTVLAFTADGKSLVSAGADKTIRVWELATCQERHQFRDDRSLALALAVSGDSRTCYSGQGDGTTLVWDLWAEGGPPPAELSAARRAALWADLAGADARQAFRAARVLAGAGQGVALLREKVRPVAAVDPRRLARLVADLDDPEFRVRDRGTRQLRDLGELAAPALRRALADQPSAEVRRRVETLLAAPDELTAEQLRGLRAVEALEHARSASARQVLRSLAGGAPAARLTQEAEAALGRLASGRDEPREEK